jgi:hypothetical protein
LTVHCWAFRLTKFQPTKRCKCSWLFQVSNRINKGIIYIKYNLIGWFQSGLVKKVLVVTHLTTSSTTLMKYFWTSTLFKWLNFLLEQMVHIGNQFWTIFTLLTQLKIVICKVPNPFARFFDTKIMDILNTVSIDEDVYNGKS